MTAWSPTWTWLTSVSSTEELTVYESVDTTTICALLEVESLEALAMELFELVGPDPLPVDPVPVELDPPDPDTG